MSGNGRRLDEEYKERIAPLVADAPWVLRVTEHKDKPVPVLVVKERRFVGGATDDQGEGEWGRTSRLYDVAQIYGASLQRCLPVIRIILNRVTDPFGVPLELQRFFNSERIDFRGNLPLDRAAGPKLALIFKLQERLADLDRVELIAWRVERFSKEEAQYWLTRCTQFGPDANRWALSGMRIMLGGQPGDPAVSGMLARLQQ